MVNLKSFSVYRITIISVVLALSIGQFAGLAGVASASPAANNYHTLDQPDGTQFEAKQWGNEFNHGWEAKNGYTITKTEDGWWMYASVDSEEIVPTDRKVGIDTPPSNVSKHLRGDAQTSLELSPESVDTTASTAPESVQSPEKMPTSGSVNLPVVLINFTDTSPTYAVTDFQSLVFGDNPSITSGPGSMKDYYEEASNGNLDVSGGSSGAQGWYTADNGHDYYGSDYTRAAELAREAVQKSDSDMDYSEYDNNNDGVVDGVIVIHQGPGQEATGDTTDIWSHRWSFMGAGLSPYETDDGVYVNSYTLQPETFRGDLTTVGIVTHETGHLLGVGDLYDTNGGSEGIGEWGLMGSGSWNGVNQAGDSPAHPTAFHKWYMGWISPSKKSLSGPTGTLEPYATTHETYQWRDNPNGVEVGGSGEYFLATNRQRVGFDQGIPGEGLIITHIDESQVNNEDETHKLVDIEAADGYHDLDNENNRGDRGDPFPGRTGATAFNSTTNPNSNLYDGSESGLAIDEIITYDDKIELVSLSDGTPNYKLSASSIEFGNVSLENGTSTGTITVTNNGTAPLEISNHAVTGGDTENFKYSGNNPQTPLVIDPDSQTTFEVTFTIDEVASKSAYLELGTNVTDRPAINISLTGTGEDRHPPNFYSTSVHNVADGSSELGPDDQLHISTQVTDAVAVQTVTVDASPLGNGTVHLTDTDGDNVYTATIPVDEANATEGTHTLTLTALDTNQQASTHTTPSFTLNFTGNDPLTKYANENGVIDASGLGEAASDFRSGEIGASILGGAAAKFRSGQPV